MDERSARHRDLSSEKAQHSYERGLAIPPSGFEPAISACERPQTYAPDGNLFHH